MQEESENIKSGYADHPKDKGLIKWQYDLLPLMKKLIIGLTFFFFASSFAELLYMQSKILQSNVPYLTTSLNQISDTSGYSFIQKLNASKLKAIILLEKDALERRHHQASISLMSRIWIKYLGFVTGMIMAFVGAAFILGKMQENQSELSGKTTSLEFSLKSTSPGIILSVLGTALMICTVFVNHTIEVNDTAVFIQNLNGDASPPPNIEKPILPPLTETDTLHP